MKKEVLYKKGSSLCERKFFMRKEVLYEKGRPLKRSLPLQVRWSRENKYRKAMALYHRLFKLSNFSPC